MTLFLAFLLFLAAGCSKDDGPLAPGAPDNSSRGSIEDESITSQLEFDASRPHEAVLVIDIPNIQDKIGQCSGQEFVLKVFLQPGRLRNDAQYSVAIEDPASPVRSSLDLTDAGSSRITIGLSQVSEGHLPPRHERIRLTIHNQGTPIPGPGDLFRHLETGCKDQVGGDLQTVLIDNLMWQE